MTVFVDIAWANSGLSGRFLQRSRSHKFKFATLRLEEPASPAAEVMLSVPLTNCTAHAILC